MDLQRRFSISTQLYSTFAAFPLRFYKFGTIICLLILLQTEYKCLIAAQGNQGGSNNLRPGPYNPIQNIFFGPLLRPGDRPPIQQRGHAGHQSQQPHQPQKQKTLQSTFPQNSKSSLSSNTALPPPPPPPVPSRAPKSIGESQNFDSPTTPPTPSIAPGTTENGATNRNPPVSGPGRPSPNPGLILTPNNDHLGSHQHHSQQHSLQRHKKLRKNPLRKRPSPGQHPSRRLPPPRHRPPIHHPRLRGPPRNGPIPHPPKKLKDLRKKENIHPPPPNNLASGGGIRNQPPLPQRGTPPTPTLRSQSNGDQHQQQQHLFRVQGVTPPYNPTTGVLPTVAVPILRDSVAQSVDEAHHNHHQQHNQQQHNHHQQQPIRNNVHAERPRRPPSLGGNDNNSRPHVQHTEHRPHQIHHPVPETIPHVGGGVGHGHEHSDLSPPPPPPPVPVIVDQLHLSIPNPNAKLDQINAPEVHNHHAPQETNTLDIIQQQQNPLHETEAPQQLHHEHPHDQVSHADSTQQQQPQQHHQMISEVHVKQLEQLTGISLTRLPLSHESLDANNAEHQHLHQDLPKPSPFHQQEQVVLDPPPNALYEDPDASQNDDTNGGNQHHTGLDHHGHHKHDLENYHIPDDILLKISPRGHSTGPVIISQIPVKSFQSADVHLSVKEPMPEKNKHNHVIDAVPATSLAGSGAAVAQLLTTDARAPRSNNIEAQSRSDDSTFFYFSQPSDLSASDSEVSSQVAFNSQRIKTKEENGIAENINHLRRERNGNSRRLSHIDDDHHLSDLRKEVAVNDVTHLHDDHESNHLDDAKDNRRIDNEVVRELVDCGGSDLGFCDMNSRYPGHMMGNLMSDCQELVYKGFVPVPEDLEELGDNGPLARYSNSSKSVVRARAGSWSWKPYTYKKKQICSSELRFIRPGYARDATGKWQVIVQTESLPQRVAIDLCHSPEQPCQMMSDCGKKSRCIQRYTFQHLLAVDPDNLHDCPTIRAFKFPAACVCHIEFPDYHSEFF